MTHNALGAVTPGDLLSRGLTLAGPRVGKKKLM